MKTFYAVLANSLAASLINTFVWFGVTFWVYLQTESVIAMSIMAGVYTTTGALSGFYLGSLVDRFSKKQVMFVSSLASFSLYLLAALLFFSTPTTIFADSSSWQLWGLIVLTLFGAIAGNVRGITLSTLVTILVPEEQRDRGNGMVGTANGVAFLAASIFSGLAIGFVGMGWMLALSLTLTLGVLFHLTTLSIPNAPLHDSPHVAEAPAAEEQGVDIRGTILAIRLVPGLFGLIFFHTFNNFLGGIFMALMDAYGLLLVSVQAWGILWGGLSLAFIVGGIVIARYGLGANPLRTLFLANIVMWTVCCIFTLQASIALLGVGMFIWLSLVPAVEAAEQTILQKVVPLERQGRVFGFAQSVEQAASPLTAFFIGPIAQWFFIPFMTTGAGVELLGPWFGTGTDRGIALLFTLAGVIGLIVTLLAMQSFAYRSLSTLYQREAAETPVPQPALS